VDGVSGESPCDGRDILHKGEMGFEILDIGTETQYRYLALEFERMKY
jgi:hypothetical protein